MIHRQWTVTGMYRAKSIQNNMDLKTNDKKEKLIQTF